MSTFLLKGSQYTLTALQLLSLDYNTFKEQLAEKVSQAPKFFNRTPIVIDLQRVASLPVVIQFEHLFQIIRDHGLVPVGIRGGTPEQQTQVSEMGLAVLPESKTEKAVEAAQEKTKTEAESAPAKEITSPSTLITQPVRSGQQIYARGGDLVITAAVSAGAEILADGHIHVYGPLRGRALAGVNGDATARIFCQSLEAELVSVAGQYCVSEDLRASHWNERVIIALQGEHLQITPLS
jgi:septum site-determining protein MinC